MDVRQENEELRCLADVLLVTGKLGHPFPEPGVRNPDGAVKLGTGVGGGSLQGEEELFQVFLGYGHRLKAAHAAPLGQDGKKVHRHPPHYRPSQAMYALHRVSPKKKATTPPKAR